MGRPRKHQDLLHLSPEAYLKESRRREHTSGKQLQYTRKHKYGVTPEEMQELRDRQDGKCAICQEPLVKEKLDHCHATGKVRGLLCHGCNVALGLLRDDPTMMARAIYYVEGSLFSGQS